MATIDTLRVDDFDATLELDSMAREGTLVHFTAGEPALSVLADELDLVSAQSATATLEIKQRKKRDLFVEGTVEAHVTQSCVVTLDPVQAVVKEDVALRLVSAALMEKVLDEEDQDLDAPAIDVLEDDVIPIGKIVRDSIALGLPPYPRKPGIEAPTEDDEPEIVRESPFAVLKSLKDDS